MDTEAWSSNTDEMTEVGIVVSEYKTGKGLNGEVGEYAENLLKVMQYHHLRIWENAHLKGNAPWMRGAEGNRFGGSRFVTFAEARLLLDSVFNQTIVSENPALSGLKRPIILVGHAIAHDKNNLAKIGLNYNVKQHGTVVAEIDTQKLVKDLSAWVHPTHPSNNIGLSTLCKDVFGFAHEDAHTALNDAARTMICAVNLALRNWGKKDKTEKSMQEVMRELEKHSQDTFVSNWGTELCCLRCGGRDHNNDQGQCKVPVSCAACTRFYKATSEIDRAKHAASHIEQFCHHIAQFNAWKRRVKDAHRKHRKLPDGPPLNSHPPSNWRSRWPLRVPGEVLDDGPPMPTARPVQTQDQVLPRPTPERYPFVHPSPRTLGHVPPSSAPGAFSSFRPPPHTQGHAPFTPALPIRPILHTHGDASSESAPGPFPSRHPSPYTQGHVPPRFAPAYQHAPRTQGYASPIYPLLNRPVPHTQGHAQPQAPLPMRPALHTQYSSTSGHRLAQENERTVSQSTGRRGAENTQSRQEQNDRAADSLSDSHGSQGDTETSDSDDPWDGVAW
jgi:hypothetical protein